MSASPSEASPSPPSHPTTISFELDSPELARTYDRVGHRQFEHGKLLLADLGVAPGHRVLDVGCGTGLLTLHAAGLVGAAGRVVAIDPLPERVQIAQGRALANTSVHVGRAEDLSRFEAASFDIVYLNSVFHWLPDQETVLRQVARVLAGGGRVGISSAAKEQPHDIEEVTRRLFRGLVDVPAPLPGAFHKVTSGELRALLESAGLRPTAIRVRTFTDHFADVDEVVAFTQSSSFGNSWSGLTDEQRTRARAALARDLEGRRDERGIVLRRHLSFAVAERTP